MVRFNACVASMKEETAKRLLLMALDSGASENEAMVAEAPAGQNERA
jgi:hypothetical protein